MGGIAGANQTWLAGMTGPGDGIRLLLTVLFAAWLAAFVFAFVAHGLTVAASEEARAAFLGWQGIAGILAVAVFGVSRNWPRSAPVRRLALAPILLAGLIVLGIIGTSLWTAGG